MVPVLRPYFAFLLMLALFGVSRAANPNVRADLRKLAQALAKGAQGKEAKDLTAKLANNPQADELELMEPFLLRTKGGLGIGAVPGAVNPDGIEAMITKLARRELNAAQLAALAKDLEEAGHVCAAVAAVLPNKCPNLKKKVKWDEYVDDFQQNSQAFINAVRGGQPKAVHVAARKLDDTCIKCHNDFR